MYKLQVIDIFIILKLYSYISYIGFTQPRLSFKHILLNYIWILPNTCMCTLKSQNCFSLKFLNSNSQKTMIVNCFKPKRTNQVQITAYNMQHLWKYESNWYLLLIIEKKWNRFNYIFNFLNAVYIRS